MNLEDWPALSTQPIGVQSDGQTVVMLHPITSPGQLLTISSGDAPTPPPPTLTLGSGSAVTAGTILPEGWVLFIDQATGAPQIIDADGSATEAPDDGEIYPISVT